MPTSIEELKKRRVELEQKWKEMEKRHRDEEKQWYEERYALCEECPHPELEVLYHPKGLPVKEDRYECKVCGASFDHFPKKETEDEG
jgi:transposase-like protein